MYRLRSSATSWPASHLEGVGEVGAALGLEPVDRRVQPADVAGRRRLKRDQRRERDQADFHGREVALRQKLASGRLGLDQGLAGHARRDVDQQEHADQLGGAAAGGRLGRPAQPREIVGHRLDRHRQPVARVALDRPGPARRRWSRTTGRRRSSPRRRSAGCRQRHTCRGSCNRAEWRSRPASGRPRAAVLAPPWVSWRYDLVLRAGIGRLRRITMSLT